MYVRTMHLVIHALNVLGLHARLLDGYTNRQSCVIKYGGFFFTLPCPKLYNRGWLVSIYHFKS
jgi:hypothetical protein